MDAPSGGRPGAWLTSAFALMVALAATVLTFAASPTSQQQHGAQAGEDRRLPDRADDQEGPDDDREGRDPSAVRITSITPSSAARGDLVTISGTGLGARNLGIAVGSVAANVLEANGHSATFRVPFGVRPGATTVVATNPGGHSSSIAFTVINRVPMANAGPDQTVFVTRTVQLNGAGSSDGDGDPLTFRWSFASRPNGSNTGLSDPSAVRPTFMVDMPGRYTLQLVVNDGFTDSPPATVLIDTQNSPPIANAGADQTVLVGAMVQLDGRGSSDVDGDHLTFRWSFVSRPAGSHASLTDDTAPSPAFVVDLPGRYDVQLVVNDGTVDSRPDTVTIDTRNSRPIANAGSGQTVVVGATVQLDGSASSDVDHDPLGLRWSFVSRPPGSLATLSDVTAVQPTFVADASGVYVVQLIVNDGTVDSAPATVAVTVNPTQVNQPPVVNAGPDQTITLPGGATLNGSVSDDGLPLGSVLTIGWSKLGGPGVVVFANASAPQTTASFSMAGDYVLRLTARDGQFTSSDDVTVTVNPAAPDNQAPVVAAGPDQTVTLPNTATLNGTATDDGLPPGSTLTITWSSVSGPGTVTFANANAASTTATFSTDGQYVLRLSASDGPLSSSADLRVTVNPPGGGGGLPPDPRTVAPPLNPTVASDVKSSTEFLYTGASPIQTGVTPGTIDARRAAVVRGKVTTRSGGALPGVRITIVGRSEFGQTLSRADGMIDMAVNGGGTLTVRYEKAGFLTAQRQINVPWQDFALLPDVVLIQLDSRVTRIDLAANAAIQVARGNPAADADGVRQATLLFSQGTTAAITMPDGSTQPLTTLNVRATEYSVGPNGSAAMPGELPPTSGYTYAVELSADEAVAAGATRVTFNQPVITYVENFLDFPVGMAVPAGFYDRDRSAWVPADNGRVVKITAVTGGLATVDTVGDRSLPPLTLGDAERLQLAALYQPGQTLWRVPIGHFTPWDCNWPYGPPPDARKPNVPNPTGNDDPSDDDCKSAGSIIQCESQSLGETVPITGTPFHLRYGSDRMLGRRPALDIPLSGAQLPASLRSIELEIQVAGQRFSQAFAPNPNQRYLFAWDGKDAYGRDVRSAQPATVRVGYVYAAVYQEPEQLARSFAVFSGVPLQANRSRQEIRGFSQVSQSFIGPPVEQQIGGWSLNPHHVYEPRSKVLYQGDGARRDARVIGAVMTTVAGNGSPDSTGDGTPATEAGLVPSGLAVAPDGSLYIADRRGRRIRRVGLDGIITTVAGNGAFGFSGDGGPATQASLTTPNGVAIASDGSIYIADSDSNRVRRVGPDGIITTVAGNGIFGSGGDGGPATQAQLGQPFGVAVAPDGSLYIADYANNRVRRVGSDGIITTVAGIGRQAGINGPIAVAVASDGSFYISDFNNHVIQRVGPDGVITAVAGAFTAGFSGDGGAAIQARLSGPLGVAVGPDGSSIYIADRGNRRIRHVRADGIISTVAGDGMFGSGGDGGPAMAAQLSAAWGVAVAPDGSVYIADDVENRVRRVGAALPNGGGAFAIASEDGTELYAFADDSRHGRTLNALTGAVRYAFTYGADGRVTAVTDGDGNVTTIERDASGNATAIVAPFGQRTALVMNADGYLSRLTNPAGQAVQIAYTADGLLTGLTDARGDISRYTYDSRGRLTRAENPAGGFKTLTRTETDNGYTVSIRTALGRTTTYRVERLPEGGTRRTVTDPSGARGELVVGVDGNRRSTFRDGTMATTTFGPDPRWGMQAPIVSSLSIRTPSGSTSTITGTRTATLVDANDPLSLATQTESLSIDGRTFTSLYDGSTRTLTSTSPNGRMTAMTLDSKGRLARGQVSGLDPTTYAYDARGRLDIITDATSSGARVTLFTYNSDGWLAGITDPEGRSTSLTYDAAGRPVSQTLPGGRTVAFAYDPSGNVTSLVPPSRPGHAFMYTALNRVASYTPPDVGDGATSTAYTYDLDRALTRVLRPNGEAIDLTYDNFGRLSILGAPGAAFSYAYDAANRLTSIIAPGGLRVASAYDGFLPVRETVSGAVAGDVVRTYDSGWRLTAHSVNGSAVAFAYDSDDLLIEAGGLRLTRGPQHGLITGTRLGTVTTGLSYSGSAELSRLSADAGISRLYDAQYTRDLLGRITQKVETIGGAMDTYEFTYDVAGRLVQGRKDGALVEMYAYDANGNRVGATVDGVTLNGSYDAQDRLTQYGSTIYGYTANGELSAKTSAGQATTFTYDALGNAIAVGLSDGRQIRYLVDGHNRRVGKMSNGALVQGFLYGDALRAVAELDGANNVVARFVYADRAHVPAYMFKAGATYRIISDHLGSVRLVAEAATGAVVQRMDYDAFGRVVNDTNPGFQPFGFAGGLYDRDTKLVRFGARDYDAEAGRWTTKDPIGFGGLDTNLYAYALNDPVNNADPDGLQSAATTGASAAPAVRGVIIILPGRPDAPPPFLPPSLLRKIKLPPPDLTPKITPITPIAPKKAACGDDSDLLTELRPDLFSGAGPDESRGFGAEPVSDDFDVQR